MGWPYDKYLWREDVSHLTSCFINARRGEALAFQRMGVVVGAQPFKGTAHHKQQATAL
jgi:hypothetical protein